MKGPRLLFGTLLLAFSLWPDAQAQGTNDASEYEPPLIEQVRVLELDSLQRGRTTVHFTPGHRERAERLGAGVDRALQFFADSLGAELDEFHLILPGRAHWKQLTADQPYGVPKSLGAWQRDNLGAERAERTPLKPPSALLPADAEGAVFEQLLTLEECITSEHRDAREQIDLSWENASRRYVEAIAFHELAHLVTDTDTYAIGMPTGWFREFLANMFGYAYLYYHEPHDGKVWDLMTAGTLDCYTPSHGRTLEEALIRGQSADDYHWLQSFLIQRANRVVETHGFDFLRRVQEVFPPRSSAPSDPFWEKVEAFEKNWERLSDEEAVSRAEEINQVMLRRLEKIAPGFHKWAQRFEGENAD